jgi:sulfite oxidase
MSPTDRTKSALGKDPTLIVREAQPFNAGPPLDLLCQSFITPSPLFFVRSHGSIPSIDLATYTLTIAGLVTTPLRLTLDELRTRFPRRRVTATLQCAGNRRDELLAVGPIPDELPWSADAISTAEWSGVALADVLEAAGIRAAARHIAFTGLDQITKDARCFGYGASISLEKARSPEVLLADEMNGARLSPEHGAPLRVVAPGYIGARSVKWLATVTAQTECSDNYYQTHAYKLFAPGVCAETADWSCAPALGDVPLTSAICRVARIPGGDSSDETEEIVARGYAYTGCGRSITRVEVALDDKEPWVQAALTPERGPWAWRLWEARLPLQSDAREIVCRAWDETGAGQPESLASVWNFKGYANTAWHRVPLSGLGR